MTLLLNFEEMHLSGSRRAFLDFLINVLTTHTRKSKDKHIVEHFDGSLSKGRFAVCSKGSV